MKDQVKSETMHSFACAVVLLIAAFTQGPYVEYVLLRVFICGSSAYIASKVYARHYIPLTWVFGAIAILFNPVVPVRMERSDWQVTNALTAAFFIAYSLYQNWDSFSPKWDILRRRHSRRIQRTKLVVRAVAATCGRMQGQNTRILELDHCDSAQSGYIVVTSAADRQKATTIANEVELRLESDWGLVPTSGNRIGGWILLDYTDFVVHIFLAEQRDFYDIERARSSARSFSPAEFNATIKHYRRG